MKKAGLSLVLLALIVAVGYIKSIRGDSRKQEYIDRGIMNARAELAEKDARIDSLRQIMGQREVDFADTLVAQKVVYSSQLDSLESLIADRDRQIAGLTRKVESIRKQQPASPKQSRDPEIDRQRRIIDYYKNRYKNLPGDLSDYERKVAINEIREDTAHKFGITAGELRALRKKYNLSY